MQRTNSAHDKWYGSMKKHSISDGDYDMFKFNDIKFETSCNAFGTDCKTKFDNQFYYMELYEKDDDGEWREDEKWECTIAIEYKIRSQVVDRTILPQDDCKKRAEVSYESIQGKEMIVRITGSTGANRRLRGNKLQLASGSEE